MSTFREAGRVVPSPSRPTSSCAGLPFILALVAAPVLAQPASTLAPITVTAGPSPSLGIPVSAGSSLGLSPRQTPASIDVIGRERLQERGDASVSEAISRATGVSAMGHPGNGLSALSVRGFTDSGSVMRLYDGLRQYGGVGVTFPFDTWSVERIEVLRGPASVIHGDGAIGGVVNIVPKKPVRAPVEHEVQAVVGTRDTARLGLGSGGAIGESLAYRLDLSGNYGAGWVERGNQGDATFSGALRWDAAPGLNITLSHAQGYQRPMRYFGTPLVDGEPLEALRRKNYNVADGFIRFRDRWTQLEANWTPSASATVRARLYHVASRRDWRNAERYVHDPASGLIERSDNTAISHDQTQTGLTANATFESRWGGLGNTLSVGFDVNRARFAHVNNAYAGSSGPVDLYAFDPGAFQSAAPTIPRYRNQAAQFAVFLENRLELTERWSVLGGARRDHARVTRDDLVAGVRALRRRYSDIGWRLGTVYDVTPELALYAQYARAADPVSGLLMLSPANAAFDMATGRQVEVGLKQGFWQGRGEWTLAAYRIRKSDLLTRDALDPALRVQVGGQSSRGIEATLQLDLGRGWSIEANATALRARYDDFTEASGGATASRNGNVPPSVPQRLANLWLGWRFQPGWTAMGGLRYVGRRYADSANTIELPSYTTVDLALRWDMSPDTAITARGHNVFDRAHFTTAYYTPTQWLYGPGRRLELALNHRF